MARSRRVQQAIALIVSAVFALTAAAQDSDDAFYEKTALPLRLVPEYLPCNYAGTVYACFDKEQIKSLYLLELQARFWHDEWRKTLEISELRTKQLDTYEKRVSLFVDIEKRNDLYIEKLHKDLLREIAAKEKWQAKAESPPTWPLWVGGTLATLGLGAFLSSLLR